MKEEPVNILWIRFKLFDYSKAGVYGTEKWKALASFDQD
jgi:hypothetical protein